MRIFRMDFWRAGLGRMSLVWRDGRGERESPESGEKMGGHLCLF